MGSTEDAVRNDDKAWLASSCAYCSKTEVVVDASKVGASLLDSWFGEILDALALGA